MTITGMLEQTMEETRKRRKTKVAGMYPIVMINSEITKALDFIHTPIKC